MVKSLKSPTLTPNVAAPPAHVAELRTTADAAAERCAHHAAAALLACTRLQGGTYDGDGLVFRPWASPGDQMRATPGVGLLADDLAAATLAGDEARLAELRDERRRHEETLTTARAVAAGLAQRRGAAARTCAEARDAYLATVRAELFAPVEALRTELMTVEAAAQARFDAVAAELA